MPVSLHHAELILGWDSSSYFGHVFKQMIKWLVVVRAGIQATSPYASYGGVHFRQCLLVRIYLTESFGEDDSS